MSDIKKALTDEIRRLAKKEIKLAIEPLEAKIALLKKRISELSKQSKAVEKPAKSNAKGGAALVGEVSGGKVRMNAKGIKRLREKLGITQDVIARIIGVSKPAYCSWEQGRISPSAKAKAKIAALRKISKPQLKKIMSEMGIKSSTPRRSKKAAALGQTAADAPVEPQTSDTEQTVQ